MTVEPLMWEEIDLLMDTDPIELGQRAFAELQDLRGRIRTAATRHTRDARRGHDDERCMSCQEESWPCVTAVALGVSDVPS